MSRRAAAFRRVPPFLNPRAFPASLSLLLPRLALCAAVTFSGCLGSFSLIAQNAPPEAIPPLRPPRPELPPTFWEQNGFWILAGSLVLLTLIVVVVVILTRSAPPPETQPAVRARETLREIDGVEETGPVLSLVSQTLKDYYSDSFALPHQQLTTAEFSRLVAANQGIGQDLANSIGDFLRRCDSRKFASHPAEVPFHAATEALQLVDAGELRRQQMDDQTRQEGMSA